MKNKLKVFSDGNKSHKIYHHRHYSGKSGNIFSIIEKPNRLCFQFFKYGKIHTYEDDLLESKITGTKFTGTKLTSGCLSRKNGKYYQYSIKRDIEGLKIRGKINLICVKFKLDKNTKIKRFNKVVDNFVGKKLPYTTIPQTKLMLVTYPMLLQFFQDSDKKKQITVISTVNSFNSAGLRASNLKECLHILFGYSNRNLIKEVAQTIKETGSLDILTIGSFYRRTVSVDYYYQFCKFLRDNLTILPRHSNNYFKFNNNYQARPYYQKFIRLIPIQKFMRFYLESLSNPWRLNDTIANWVINPNIENTVSTTKPTFKAFNISEFSTMEALHDHICETNRRRNQTSIIIEPEKEYTLDKNIEKLKDIDGAIVGDMELVVPKTNTELATWSDLMSNCIGRGSYGPSAKDGRILLLGIKRQDKMVYNISLRNGMIDQFLAKFNAQADKVDRELVE